MLGLPMLDVVIGLVFVYLLMALICASDMEMVVGLFDSRSGKLLLGIQTLRGEHPDYRWARKFKQTILSDNKLSSAPGIALSSRSAAEGCRVKGVPMSTRHTGWLVFVVIAAILIVPTHAVSYCDEALTPSESVSMKYQARGEGASARCEGFYVAKVGASSLQLVGLTYGAFAFRLTAAEKISVRPAFRANVPLHVRAVGVRAKTYYRMDAQLDPKDEYLDWPASDVLFPEKLGSESVDVYAWIDDEGQGRVYWPLEIKASQGASGSTTSNSGERVLELRVTSTVELEKLMWRHAPLLDGQCGQASEWKKVDVPGKMIHSDNKIRIPLLDVSSPLTCITVTGKESVTAEWALLHLKIHTGE